MDYPKWKPQKDYKSMGLINSVFVATYNFLEFSWMKNEMQTMKKLFLGAKAM
jgi:hypothetical protein